MTVKEFAITNECKDNSLESPPKGPMGNWCLTKEKLVERLIEFDDLQRFYKYARK